MKNILVALTVIFAISLGATAQGVSGPDMDFEFSTHDFGKLNEGDNAEVEFTFTNTGTEKLIITNVKASCGCTTPFWSKEPVMPGEQGKITAKYNTVNKSGSFNKSITINSNMENSPNRIFIKGNVIKGPTDDGVPERTPSIVNDLSD